MTTETAPQVLVTRDYSIFHFLPGNRTVSSTYLKRLSGSILERNLMNYLPILVNENHEIIDGQHRFEIARQNNLPVYYTIVPHANLKEVHLLNNTVKAWTLNDYLKSYSDLGKREYTELGAFIEDWNVSIGVAISLLSGVSIEQGGSSLTRNFREGNFSITHAQEAEDFMVRIERFRTITSETKILRDRAFLEAVRIAFTFVTPEAFFAKLTPTTEKIPLSANTTEYLRILERIYNYRLSLENNVRFF